METWPQYAKPLADGFEQSADFGMLRTSMDSGIAKQKSRYSKPIVTTSISFIVDKADKLAFDLWVDSNLHGGSDWFNYYDCITNTTKKARIVEGAVSWIPIAASMLWKATLKMETL
jgi:hypothetical protein